MGVVSQPCSQTQIIQGGKNLASFAGDLLKFSVAFLLLLLLSSLLLQEYKHSSQESSRQIRGPYKAGDPAQHQITSPKSTSPNWLISHQPRLPVSIQKRFCPILPISDGQHRASTLFESQQASGAEDLEVGRRKEQDVFPPCILFFGKDPETTYQTFTVFGKAEAWRICLK